MTCDITQYRAEITDLRAKYDLLKKSAEAFLEEADENLRSDVYNAENKIHGGTLGPPAPPRWQAKALLRQILATYRKRA